MQFTRRRFIKLTGAGVAGLSLVRLGFNVKPVQAYAAKLKIEGAKEVISICHFCSCGCNLLMHVKNGKLINVEGDPDYPISEGSLCAKGAAILSMHNNEKRLLKPLYRAPGSDKWEEKDWDWMLNTIARRIKDTRDKNFIEKNAQGRTVNRVESIFHYGGSQLSNEECALHHQFLRGLGVVYLDHQARV